MGTSPTPAQAPPSTPARLPIPGRVVRFPGQRRPRWPWVVAAFVVVVAVVGVLIATGRLEAVRQLIPGQAATTIAYQTVTVAKGTVAKTVAATGPIAAAQTLPLSFKTSGKLTELKVGVGQKIKKGDVLARLDPTDLQAALDQAKTNLAQQQANFAKLQAGATPEEIAAAKVALQNAQQAASDAAAAAAASTASTQQDVQAAQASVSSAQTNVQSAQDALAAAKEQAQKTLAADQTAVDNAQKALDAARAIVATSPAILKQQLEKAKDDLWAAQISRDLACSHGGGGQCDAAKATVAGLETALNQQNATAEQTRKQNDQTLQAAQAALDTTKANLANDQAKQAATIKTAENNVKAAEQAANAAQVGVAQSQGKAASSAQSAQQSINTAQASVKTAEANLATTSAAPTKAELDAQAAQVANAQVAVQTAQNDLDAATLTAPMDGTVTAISGVVGQWLGGGAANTSTSSSTTSGLITLATLDDLQVTANVNEADVGTVKLGDPVSFTVSAFPGKTFAGQVAQIQPSGTTISNVVTFAITSSITSVEGVTLYPGMTASVTITTAEHGDVLLVPDSALAFAKTAIQQGLIVTTAESGQKTVATLQDGKPVAVAVTTGMTDGINTEVTTGLQEGQVVVTGQAGGATTARTTTGTATPTPRSTSPLTTGGPGAGPPPGAPPGP